MSALIRNFLVARPRKGFTLIELMIAISIIAILAAVGITTFSQSQKLGRDARRKQDLRSLSVALELYRQKNGRYPCAAGATGWVTSSGGGNWITDGVYQSCNGTGLILDKTYINSVPVDPINTTGNPWVATTNYAYGYRNYNTSCPTKVGQFYLLIAQLENKTDPDRQELKLVKDCQDTTTTSLTGGAWPTSFVLSSD